MGYTEIIFMLVALVFAALIAFTTTPIVRVLAYKIGAIDVPKDDRRMHKTPIPRLGGLAIFLGFTITTFIFCVYSPTLIAIWFGGLIIVALGVLDDVFRLNAIVKFVVQIVVAFIAVSQGVVIEHINFFGTYILFGNWSIPITILWIVGLTNAINLIDGLDGLACGVSAICSISLLIVTIIMTEPASAMLTAILTGSCLGFLPFNSNPAKIFMGDTGALFLGYTLACVSISGVFKLHAVISFMIPLSIFALPLFDTAFAILRRICTGKPPFSPDRGHLHHRLVDMGFNQKQAVHILYAICGILGISAVMFTEENIFKSVVIIVIGLIVFLVNFIIIGNKKSRENAGFELTEKKCEKIEEAPLTETPVKYTHHKKLSRKKRRNLLK